MKLILIISGLISMTCSSALYADYDESSLNKLFTDKKQRAQIDAIRAGKSNTADSQQSNTIRVHGYMTRSNGKSVVWVNNKNTLESSRIGDIKVYQKKIGNNKKVFLSTDGKSAQLKPGETWHKETGEIVDQQ